MTKKQIARFKAKVNKTDKCWLWNAAINSAGYGVIRQAGRLLLAHRVSFQMKGEKIPFGMVIDHLCKTRNCVKPKHMRILTLRNNTRYGVNGIIERDGKEFCRNNHELNPKISRCITCQKEKKRSA